MRHNRSSTIFLLACFVLLLSLVAGCGGAGQDSGNQTSGNQDSGSNSDNNGGESQSEDEASQEQGNGTGQPSGGGTGQDGGLSRETKIAIGDVLSVDAEDGRLVLKPVQGERQVIKVRPNAEVTLDDNPAELSVVEEGQQAQIRYIVWNDRYRATAISAFSEVGQGG